MNELVTVVGLPDSAARQLVAGLVEVDGTFHPSRRLCIGIDDECDYASIYLDREEAAQLIETLSEFLGAMDAMDAQS